MKQIKLNKVPYLRYENTEAFIEDENVEFINGVALVKAILKSSSKGGSQSSVYDAFGLINENFEEIYCDEKLEGMASRKLMFLPYNKFLIRVDTDDYLSSVRVCDGDRTFDKYYHIRVIDGIPTVMQEFSQIMATHDPKFVTDGHALYDVMRASFVTRKYSLFESLPVEKDGVPAYLVSTEVSSYCYPNSDTRWMPINIKTGIVDNLTFVIDREDQIISPVYSMLDHDWYVKMDENISLEEIEEKRKTELREMEDRGIRLSQGLRSKQFVKLPKSLN